MNVYPVNSNVCTFDNKKDVTIREEKKDWACSICSKGFKYPYTLLRHMPIHTRERRYKCDRCPKAFRQMSTLSQHKATHSSAKPYTCDTCGKAFNRGSTLISHRRTHQNVKRFVCSICRKAFHQKGNLVNHIYTHTNERPYRCDVCSRGFNQKSNLVCHMFTLHGEKKLHSCDFCPASFSRENAYRAHINTCHRLGTMPLVESDKLSSIRAKLFMIPNNIDDNSEITIHNESSHRESNSKHCFEGITSLIYDNEWHFNRNNSVGSSLRVNILTSPKKPILKIPASPIFSDMANKMIMTKLPLNSGVECELRKNLVSSNELSSRRVIADVVITDMGRNLVVSERPPVILEAARSCGRTPFLLLVEPTRPPRLCKASLGTEGFIVSPVTNIDLDLDRSARKLKISIVMTLERVLMGNAGLKTFIHLHERPIQLSFLRVQSDYILCKSSNCAENNKALNIQLKKDIYGHIRGQLSGKRIDYGMHENAFLIPTDVINTCKMNEQCRLGEERFSESEDIIRFHLSQVGEIEEQNEIKPWNEENTPDDNCLIETDIS